MAYTKHGHHIPGTQQDALPPIRARCGGLTLCNQCQSDVHAHFAPNIEIHKTPNHIEERFGYRRHSETTGPTHATVRQLFKELAYQLDAILPEGRNKSVTFTELETAQSWATKAVSQLDPVVL